jgi:hypothetical protein
MVPKDYEHWKRLHIKQSAMKIKLSIWLIKYHVTKTYGGGEVYFHTIFIIAADVTGQLHFSVALL